MKKTLLSLSASIVFAASTAFAETPLTTANAEKFIASLPDADALGDAFRAEGLSIFDDEAGPKPGEAYDVYSTPVAALKADHPDAYRRLNALAKEHGFSNAASWAGVGDKVMRAYFALSAPTGMPNMADMMTPEMLANLPPEARAQFERSQAMVSALEGAPAADIEALRPALPDLEAALSAGAPGGPPANAARRRAPQ